MKARKVDGLDPADPLADNAERIVSARLDELCAFVPRVLDPSRVEELHDMRIAAKRLRYALEVTADVCFGPYAHAATKRARELQDLLGEIHDCDVQLPRVEALIAELREDDVADLRRRAGAAEDLDPALAARLPHASSWRGLIALATYLRTRRALLHDRFRAFWVELEREGFRARLEYAIAERLEPPAGDDPWSAGEPEPEAVPALEAEAEAEDVPALQPEAPAEPEVKADGDGGPPVDAPDPDVQPSPVPPFGLTSAPAPESPEPPEHEPDVIRITPGGGPL